MIDQGWRVALTKRLTAPTDTAGLAAFRALVGVMVSISAIRFLAYGWVEDFFVAPHFFFKHWGFSWVPVPPAPYVHLVFALLAAGGACVALGLWYRPATVATAIGFTWVQLFDATNYLNHYYLVSLLLLLLGIMPLGRVHALDVVRGAAKPRSSLPAWMTWLLRFQLTVVYVNAALAKVSSDWLLHAQPLNIWLCSRTELPIIGELLGYWPSALAMSWAGFAFDLTIPFFMMVRRTRPYAYVVLVGFHAATGYLFPIGMFPVIMVLASTIFFSPSWPRRVVTRFGLEKEPPSTPGVSARPPRWALPLAAAYVMFQVLFPLRSRLYGGNVAWHEQGMRFAWKVMVREKNGTVTYHLEDEQTGRRWFVRPRRYLDARQEREFSTQPDLILQLAHRIRDDESALGRDVKVRAEVLVSLNGRPPALLLDPARNLAVIDDGVGRATWILPAPDTPPAKLGRR